MRFNVAAAAASAAFLVGGVNAEDQKVLKDESSSVAESATQAAPELPTFTVSISTAPPTTLPSRLPSLAANRQLANIDIPNKRPQLHTDT